MAACSHLSRRDFLKTTSACGAHLAMMAAPFPATARALWSLRSRGQIVAQESFGRLESMGEGLWAFISTPLGGDYTTVCNGGIIAGQEGILVVEAFQTPEGSRWIAEKARELAGKWPTHVLVTHYHSDHSDGVEGFFTDGSRDGTPDSPQSPPVQGTREPTIHTTETTRDLKTSVLRAEAPESLRRLWADVVLVSEMEPGTIDLGARTVRLDPRRGHTASDVTVMLPDEGITWCGDLVWNGMFPNYMDAIPSRLSNSVRALQALDHGVYVPGHGPLAGAEDFARYVAVIDGLEQTARTARREGWTAEEAAARHRIADDLGQWTLFNPSYFQRAVEAWMKEWDSGG
jgi:glyoxylase-like metal-dependent hydrolase (beta-lactamase superfamily II)